MAEIHEVEAMVLKSWMLELMKIMRGFEYYGMRIGLVNKYTTTGVYKDNLFICSIAYYGREVCFHSEIKVGARIFRARGMITQAHSRRSHMASWDDQLHIFSVDHEFGEKKIRFSTTDNPKFDW
ncbi:Oidioi.mRNA.OKI2018_I69.PAR.g12751.t1.cds [Oikopleura dioica]|uniref:Oidioi.mRNA.OKI2018_I69.PAR.g12751.t1.cds n=1 Tax=Oikopleura dioica TaxID=34765 RepID=A0ABN7S253_OIKDI|nr:Oidioi.mRNA.OKI2018_I69.PAR.g12751.t1.cds [Oikopleura dioica]